MPGWLAIAMSLAVLVAVAPSWVTVIQGVDQGADLDLYLRATRRWLEGGGFYESYQLAGPYQVVHGSVLYPPFSLWLFVPFTALPTLLWWVVPSLLIGWSLRKLRPRPWSWPVMTLLTVFSPALVTTWAGNPVIWAAAALFVGCVAPGPAVFVLLKPSLAPFALVGIRHREWLVFLAVLALAALPFGSMWLDWFAALVNSRAPITYSLREVLVLAIPLVAWLGRGARNGARPVLG